MQRFRPTAYGVFRELSDRAPELAFDAMARLALTQVATAGQRKREILSRHGTPITRKTPVSARRQAHFTESTSAPPQPSQVTGRHAQVSATPPVLRALVPSRDTVLLARPI